MASLSQYDQNIQAKLIMVTVSNSIAVGSTHFQMIETGKRSGSLEKCGEVDTLIPDRWLWPWLTHATHPASLRLGQNSQADIHNFWAYPQWGETLWCNLQWKCKINHPYCIICGLLWDKGPFGNDGSTKQNQFYYDNVKLTCEILYLYQCIATNIERITLRYITWYIQHAIH